MTSQHYQTNQTSENEEYSSIAMNYGISLYYEVFADRNYNDDGSLVARSNENAVIHDEFDVMDRITLLKENGYLYSINKQRLFLRPHTICVHGDNEQALEFVKNIRKLLN